MKKLVAIHLLVVTALVVTAASVYPQSRAEKHNPSVVIVTTYIDETSGYPNWKVAPPHVVVWFAQCSDGSTPFKMGDNAAEVFATLMAQGYRMSFEGNQGYIFTR